MARPSPQTDRVVAVARLLAAHPEEGFTISEIARRLRLHKATVHPMLVALTEAGWLVRDAATKAFRLGPELMTLGEAAGRSLPAVQVARPLMLELATELGVTCAAFTESGGVATLVDQVWDVRSTVQPLRIGIWAPVRAPFGAVFRAWAPADDQAEWLEGVDAADRERYAAVLEASRGRGYVVELRTPTTADLSGTGSLADVMHDHDFLVDDLDPEREYALGTIEAPLLDGAERVALGLVLVGLPRTMTGAEIDAYGRRLATAGRGAQAPAPAR